MSTTTRTSELEAINTMLSCISEAPINDLATTGVVDVDIAKSVLNETSRVVQMRGWYFNTETDYPLIRNSAGKIAVPSNCLKIDSTPRYAESYPVVTRGDWLYNLKERSLVFDQDIEGELVFLLPWDQLPEAARRYIMVCAARVFQTRQLGSDTQHKFSEADEFKAKAEMEQAESEQADHNVLADSWDVARILSRV